MAKLALNTLERLTRSMTYALDPSVTVLTANSLTWLRVAQSRFGPQSLQCAKSMSRVENATFTTTSD